VPILGVIGLYIYIELIGARACCLLVVSGVVGRRTGSTVLLEQQMVRAEINTTEDTAAVLLTWYDHEANNGLRIGQS
jgi:hypothetical protein